MKKKMIAILMCVGVLVCLLCGCQRQSDRVAYNI